MLKNCMKFWEEEKKLIKPYNFLTNKPFIYAFNVSEEDLAKADEIKKEFESKLWKPVSIERKKEKNILKI